jgi:hypothetical protein
MSCRCSERREAIIKAAVAVAHGDRKTAADAARFVRDSAVEDAAAAAAKLRRAAAARLGSRR